MDEFELIRWPDVLVETGKIQRWQTGPRALQSFM
jgi:hypothetical protein